MHGCDIVFSADTAEKVKAELGRQWGQCPCDETRCPLLPRDSDIANLAPCLAEMAPESRRVEKYASRLMLMACIPLLDGLSVLRYIHGG